ncbi:MAG TPA: hypothetical protein DCF33_07300, partial [Saprospirales bacterium]|nr:hypothetical protein [Saprospirales bacterium]
MFKPINRLSILFFAAFLSQITLAQVSITNNQMVYTQSFDALPNSTVNWVNNATLPNWYAARTNASVFSIKPSDGSSSGTYL